MLTALQANKLTQQAKRRELNETLNRIHQAASDGRNTLDTQTLSSQVATDLIQLGYTVTKHLTHTTIAW